MYLLDTCAFIWYLEGSSRLSERARAIIDNEENVYLSLTTFWEIAIKKTIKKLELNKTTAELQALCESGGIRVLPIDAKYFDTIQHLPLIHGDPFDRLIIATAKEEGFAIVTDDERIQLYSDVETVW